MLKLFLFEVFSLLSLFFAVWLSYILYFFFGESESRQSSFFYLESLFQNLYNFFIVVKDAPLMGFFFIFVFLPYVYFYFFFFFPLAFKSFFCFLSYVLF